MMVGAQFPWRFVAMLASVTLMVGCGDAPSPGSESSFDTPPIDAALAAITAESIETHIRVLADDSLQGRAPGTAGFEGATRYVESMLESFDLEPAGTAGTFRQSVPL